MLTQEVRGLSFSNYIRSLCLSCLCLCFSCCAETQPRAVGSAAPLGNDEKITDYASCIRAGNKVLRSFPARCVTSGGFTFVEPTSRPDVGNGGRPICKNLCGNGHCEEIVCMAVGCPCGESHASCPSDCP